VVNHFRNLLINLDGNLAESGYLAEEFIDPDFRALSLPTPIQQVRRVLFGADPDKHMLALRTRQLLAIIHATPLRDSVLDMDPRITYDFKDKSIVSPETWIPQVRKLSGTGTCTVLGTPDAPDVSGRVYHNYLLTVVSAGQLAVERQVRPIQKTFFEFTPNTRIKLPGSGCDVRLSADSGWQEYAVSIYAKPALDAAALCDAAAKLGEPTLNYVFGIEAIQPWQTLRSLFFRKLELPLRLSALLCALVYRCEALRKGQ